LASHIWAKRDWLMRWKVVSGVHWQRQLIVQGTMDIGSKRLNVVGWRVPPTLLG